jgi:hypothetical protein
MPIKRRKKKRRKNKDKYGKLVSKLKQRGLLEEKEILYQPSGEVKMSEVIMDFIEPYREYANTYEAHRKLITLALLAWNAALLPENEQKAMVEKVVGSLKLSKSDTEGMMNIVEEMIERKNKYFVDYTRTILDYQLSYAEEGFHLSVASMLEVDETES